MDYKICTNCHKSKPIEEFWKNCGRCKICGVIKNHEWKVNNREKSRAIARRHYQKNKEKILEYRKEYRKVHPEKTREKGRRDAQLRRNKRNGHLKSVISNAIYKSLKGQKGGKKWEILVGYTLEDLKKNLERQFQLSMTWENYGDWHIDHIIPISAFNFEKPEDIDFKRCWALSNLRPIWAKQNLLKANKLDKPFQPSFTF